MLVTRLSSLAPMSGASFSKAPETFRARKTISVSQYLKQRCVSVLPCQWVGDTDLTLMLSILSLFLVTAAAAAHDVSPSSAPLLSTVLLLIPATCGLRFGAIPQRTYPHECFLSAFTYIPHTVVHQDDAVIPAP